MIQLYYTNITCNILYDSLDLVSLLSITSGYLNAPVSRFQKLTSSSILNASPGEVSESPVNSVQVASNQFRKLALPIAAVASLLLPLFSNQVVNAAEGSAAPVAEEAKVVLGPLPTDWGLSLKDFYSDAQKVLFQFIYPYFNFFIINFYYYIYLITFY